MISINNLVSLFIELFATSFEVFIVFGYFNNLFAKKFKNQLLYILTEVFFVALITYFDKIKMYANYKILFTIMVFIIILRFLYIGRFINKLLIIFLVIALLIMADLLAFSIENVFMINNIFTPLNSMYHRILMILVSKTLLFLLLKLCSKKNIYLNNNSKLTMLYYFLIIILPMITTSAFFVVFYSLQFAPETSNVFYAVLTMSIGMLLLNIFVFHVFDALLNGMQIQNESKLMQQQYEFQIKHFENIEKSQENIRAIKHDINNHIFSIQALIEKGQIEEAKNYISTIDEKIARTNLFSDSGNIIIDALLDNRYETFKSNDINVSKKIIIPKELNIENHDLCTVLSNLLDNAIDACTKIRLGEERFIDICLEYKKNFLYIKISNNFEIKPIERNGRFITSKNNSEIHGFGLSNVKSVVEKYNGHMDIKVYGNIFKVEIFMCDKQI